ncbi:MAG: hypothetical protein H0Z24_05890 [Thermosipho sp. (in: Bacteria)]|nr:hypothetical protein [Thermosipho sp. (in: thermotogales)]
MQQNEIDKISEAFSDAWKEFFGQEMYYIKFKDTNTPSDTLYYENDVKEYDRVNKIKFYGSIKFNPTKKEIELAGLKEEVTAIITVVTKQLVDAGIQEVSFNDLIEITDRFGNTSEYSIIDKNLKVQFSNNFIFTKIGVIKNE